MRPERQVTPEQSHRVLVRLRRMGSAQTHEAIVARWRRIWNDPLAIPVAKRMAKEALANLGETEREREPGEEG